ncbi:MAG: hypothetical protein HF962_03180 [Sulfurovum sp.]|nr:hypothetical protein [Sulfurovum sp.]
MKSFKVVLKWLTIIMSVIVITNCGGGGNNNANGAGGGNNPAGGGNNPIVGGNNPNDDINTTNGGGTGSDSEFDRASYRGLSFYHKVMPSADYKLDQLTDSEFNELSNEKQLKIANKILTSLFFGYKLSDLKSKIAAGNFLSTVRGGLEEEKTDKGWLEDHILDDSIFKQYQSSWYEPQAITILSRFYAMEDLDQYFLNNWTAYILTQTIMFSPAYELSSSHTPDISGVYNRLVTMLENESGMRFITYVHMMSESNWRRFRSPEDNGREMLEIYLLDTNDSHVPIAGKALRNWKLNTDSDTLEVGLNRNTIALPVLTNFFGGEPIITGEDFYRELAKSSRFIKGVTRRLVDFFFPEKDDAKKISITDSIVSSNPETWQDILLQIIFSEEYLLHNSRAQSAEETFYSLAKKIDYRHRRDTFRHFKDRLEEMHQASMKYKLGKIERVPLDSLSFAHYHKFIRESILIRKANPEQTDRDNWNYHGWQESFIGFDKFSYDEENINISLKNFVDYLFEVTIARKATSAEHTLFKNHMIETDNGTEIFKYAFNMFTRDDDRTKESKDRAERKGNIAYIVLDYISRLDASYRQSEVR